MKHNKLDIQYEDKLIQTRFSIGRNVKPPTHLELVKECLLLLHTTINTLQYYNKERCKMYSLVDDQSVSCMFDYFVVQMEKDHSMENFVECRQVDTESQDFTWYMKQANQGYHQAQYMVGHKYLIGDGVAQCHDTALDWFLRSAYQGNVNAQNSLGLLFFRGGSSVKQDYAKALKWFKTAADKGHALAQNNLGIMYRNGYGADRDMFKAMEWHLRSAYQGEVSAQNSIGYMYYNGCGVDQNFTLAFQWYFQAACQGDASAQNNLGMMFFKGEGVPQDNDKAREWFQKSADQGNASACKNLKVVRVDDRNKKSWSPFRLAWYAKKSRINTEKK